MALQANSSWNPYFDVPIGSLWLCLIKSNISQWHLYTVEMTPSYRVDLANWLLCPNLVTIAQSRCSHFTLNFLSLHMVWLQAGHEDEHLMIPWPFSTNQSSVLAHSWIGTNTTHASPPCCHWESFCGVIFCCSACGGLSVHSYSDLSYSFSCEPFIR